MTDIGLTHSQNMTRVFILRHGEVEGGRLFRGSQDDPMTRKGWRQMQAQMSQLDHWIALTSKQSPASNGLRIISSPLKRCFDFAQRLGQKRGWPVKSHPGFQEIHFGDWEGKSYAQLADDDGQALEKFYTDPINHPPPNGEALLDFYHRVQQAIETEISAHPDRDILLITHGGVQKILISHALNMPLQSMHHIDTPYASLSQLTVFSQPNSFYWIFNQHTMGDSGIKEN